jgi:head-tail adaptor
MGLQAGKLRHRISFLEKSLTKDDMGGFTETTPTLTSVWASIDPKRAGEAFDNAQTEHTITHEITVRDGSHLDTLGPDMYVTFGARRFEIRGIRGHLEVGEFLIIDAVEQPARTPAVQA